MGVWEVAVCKLCFGVAVQIGGGKMLCWCLLAWGFGRLLCVNCIWGNCANRRCENVALMSSWHASLGVAVPIEGMKILR